ncbi:universal stress protein [Aquisalimonas sp.]|uniref:universal stress protein n=1 Tax=Aquisalimonas sp. TaxID=1872621 RepID=UPI0025C492A4|nr:universal stress protein [Aquisalimonas sp.]
MYKKVLAVADLADERSSINVLDTAIRQLAPDGDLGIVAVLEDPGAPYFPHIPRHSPTERLTSARRELDRLAAERLPQSVQTRIRVLRGGAGPALVKAAKADQAELVILPESYRRARLGALHGPAHYVGVHAPCAVLFVRNE